MIRKLANEDRPKEEKIKNEIGYANVNRAKKEGKNLKKMILNLKESFSTP